jgi:hypothetical protein
MHFSLEVPGELLEDVEVGREYTDPVSVGTKMKLKGWLL